jgi:hypothetical protein
VRNKAAIAFLSIAILITGCSNKKEASTFNADAPAITGSEVQVNLTAAQAKAGTEARVAIPERRETVTVRIPAGVRDGMRLRLPGKALPLPDGTPRDFYVRIRVK